jgi:hypothetical protein
MAAVRAAREVPDYSPVSFPKFLRNVIVGGVEPFPTSIGNEPSPVAFWGLQTGLEPQVRGAGEGDALQARSRRFETVRAHQRKDPVPQ